MVALGENIEITDSQLIIKPIPIKIVTESARKAHDGTPLTAGGTVTIGADDDDQNFPDGPVTVNIEPGQKSVTIPLADRNEVVVVEITGSQEDVGSSQNTVAVHWSNEDTTAKQHNYTVTKSLGTLTVYDFTAEFDKNTSDTVHGMPEDWEGDAPNREYKLPSNEPTKEHSTFHGWNTKPDGTGDDYAPGSTYTYPANETDVKFYAQWDKEVDEVTYDPNGGKFRGSTRPTEIDCEYEEEINIAEAATWANDDYDFVGWKDSNTGDVRDPGDEYTVKGEVTFTAQWKPHEYKIEYELDGGSMPSDANPTEYTVEDDIDITTPPTKEGFRFDGWTWDGQDTPEKTISWKAGEERGDKKYTANWTPIRTLTFDPDGGTFRDSTEPTDIKEPEGEKITIPEAPERDGYVFKGWEEVDGDIYQPGDDYEVTDNTKFIAVWEPIKTLTFVPNGGEFRGKTTPTKIQYTGGKEISIPEAAKRKGYNFLGWEAGDKTYQPGDPYVVEDDAFFVAMWEKNDDPDDPDDPDKEKKKKKKDKKPETGDTFQLGYFFIMLMSAAAAATILMRRRREE